MAISDIKFTNSGPREASAFLEIKMEEPWLFFPFHLLTTSHQANPVRLGTR